eukprot:403345445
MQATGGGSLTIKVVEGKLTRDTETFGKMDPFVQIEYNGNKYKTRVHQGGGKTPSWNHEIQLHVGGLNDDLTLKVMDEDVTKDDFIGMTLIKMSSLCINNGVRDWFSINYKTKSAGQVLLETRYIPSGGAGVGVGVGVQGMAGFQQPVYQQQPMMMPGQQFGQVPPMPQYQVPQGGYQAPPQGYYPPQQYPPQGQYPPGYQAPQGQYPQGYQYPPGYQVPPQGQYPPGQYPPQGQYPPAQYPPQGQYPPGYQYPQGQYPPGYSR